MIPRWSPASGESSEFAVTLNMPRSFELQGRFNHIHSITVTMRERERDRARGREGESASIRCGWMQQLTINSHQQQTQPQEPQEAHEPHESQEPHLLWSHFWVNSAALLPGEFPICLSSGPGDWGQQPDPSAVHRPGPGWSASVCRCIRTQYRMGRGVESKLGCVKQSKLAIVYLYQTFHINDTTGPKLYVLQWSKLHHGILNECQ